jgi:thiol:disulfide interchange protein/DsbC/DsbD-like thiol-disulfide interchange protein
MKTRFPLFGLYVFSLISLQLLSFGQIATAEITELTQGANRQHTSVRLLANVRTVQPGSRFMIGVLLRMDKGWHTYWKNSGDAGLPTQIEWTLPSGIAAGEVQWPVPYRFVEGGDIVTYGYKDETMLLVPMTAAESVQHGSTVVLKALVRWLECERICIPGEAKVELVLPVDGRSPLPDHVSLFATYGRRIPLQLDSFSDIAVSTRAASGSLTFTMIPSGKRNLAVHDGVVPDFYPEQPGKIALGEAKVSDAQGRVVLSIPLTTYEAGLDLPNLRGILVYQFEGGDRAGVSMSIPLSREFAATIPLAGENRESPTGSGGLLDQQFSTSFAEENQQPLYLYVLYAIIGGLLLNIMPCVLPVIGLKVFGLIRMSADQPRQVRRLGWMFSLGILASFLVLALLVIILKTAGEQVGWGFQFQEPAFIIFMSAVVFAFGLSLFGVYEIRLPGAAVAMVGSAAEDRGRKGKGYFSSFSEGILATILATPCTAPILGTALGFAFAQPPGVILLMFASIAFGMSLPYLLLTWQPAWRKYLPKPGEWMVTAKQFMGFLMMATLLWLLYILGKQLGMEAVIWTGAFLLMVGVACWVIGRFATLTASRMRYALSWIAAVALIVLGYWAFVGPLLQARDLLEEGSSGGPRSADAVSPVQQGIPWRPFSVAALESALKDKVPVFIDFTADWCLTCKVNERAVLADAKVVERFKTAGMVPFRADWTSRNADITRLLSKFGRSGVPLYVIFPSGRPRDPILLPEVITTGIVIDAIDRALMLSATSAPQ